MKKKTNFFKTFDDNELQGLNDELISFYVDELFSEKQKDVVLVTSTFSEANKLYNYLKTINNEVLFFPMDDFLTSVLSTKSPEFKTMRVDVLNELVKEKQKIVVTHLMGLLKYVPSKKEWQNFSLKIKINDEIDITVLTEKLIDMGYNRESIVTNTGEVAVRGFVIDIFPVGMERPVRLEFFGDEIEKIKTFDVESQRSIENLDKIDITPFKDEIEGKSCILDYLDNAIIVYKNYNQILANYKTLAEDVANYNLEYNDLSFYMNRLEDLKIVETKNLSTINLGKNPFSKVGSLHFSFDGNIDKIKNFILENQQSKIIVCSKNKMVKNLLNKLELPLKNINNVDDALYETINFFDIELYNGFIVDNYIFLTNREILNKAKKVIPRKSYKYGSKISDISSLNVGDYVVHDTYGIGVFKGLITLEKEGMKKDYILVAYAGTDKLYIPVEKIELLSKYAAKEGSSPKINKIGGVEWQNLKRNLRKKISGIASELIKIYAKRQMQEGYAFAKDSEEQTIFEEAFEYDLTHDQQTSLDEIKNDMEKNQPMDRLLCGDVGYGKTEVAFRAIFKAIYSGKQCVILCPTTILARQHYKNAIERFSGFAVNIAVLNRFTTKKENEKIREDVERGTIDLLIGTHKILTDKLVYKDLGLLVVDEEQRFGVSHKEKIKGLKANVDVLTLSATPIPRTLQMSLNGIKQLSVIETAPVDRQPVQTYVIEEKDEIIIDAIYKEKGRDGQVFLLYNDTRKIEEKMHYLEAKTPDINYGFIHGKMNKADIEKTLSSFVNSEFDVLLCTTIIETGIDMPNVNTLIVLDADKFGLSQLYQLRGRVGRSNKIAYAYLMYNENKVLNENAVKRLDSIKEFTALGSGMSIAMRDLAIRGAGDLLGGEQAGFIDAVGIDLYNKILNQEIERIKGNDIVEEEIKEAKPLIDIDTHIDDYYVTDEKVKIEIHNMINSIDSYEKLKEIKVELEDRFGEISNKMLIYMHEELLEKQAMEKGIEKIDNIRNKIIITFNKEVTKKIDIKYLYSKIYTNEKIDVYTNKEKLTIEFKPLGFNKHYVYVILEILEYIILKS